MTIDSIPDYFDKMLRKRCWKIFRKDVEKAHLKCYSAVIIS